VRYLFSVLLGVSDSRNEFSILFWFEVLQLLIRGSPKYSCGDRFKERATIRAGEHFELVFDCASPQILSELVSGLSRRVAYSTRRKSWRSQGW